MSTNAVIIPIVEEIRLKKVLYATDFSDKSLSALPLVSGLARRYGSSVFVAHVCKPHIYPLINPEATGLLDASLGEEAHQQIEELVHISPLNSLSTSIVVKSGETVEELEKIVRDEGIDLAVLSTHGHAGFKRAMMGSVAEEAFRTLSCPVLTVGPHLLHRFATASTIKSILFPTDLSEESMAVLPALASLAHEYKASLTVLHVLPVETAGNPDAASLTEPLRTQLEQTCLPWISPECKTEFVIEAGDTAERILEQARTRNVDLIGFGVRKAGQLSTHFRNTVAYRVVVKAHCPVLTQKF
jgi:nucleotide-binding universal stress UspA family protein